jgi:hypothetical protein
LTLRNYKITCMTGHLTQLLDQTNFYWIFPNVQ